jgi:phage-related minor tail protein
MAVLECVKPGAKLGQIILAVDLTVAGAVIAFWQKFKTWDMTQKFVMSTIRLEFTSWQFSKTNSIQKQSMMTTG